MAYKFDTSGGVEVYWWSRIFGTSSPLNYLKFNEVGNRADDSLRFGSVLSNGFQAQYYLNSSGDDFVALCWKINGNSSNPDVNSDIGMSMRTYTGNGSYRNMSHGLGTSNVFPIINSYNSNYPWTGRPIGGSWTDYTTLTDNSSGTFDDYFTWQDTSATSTNVRLGFRERVNHNGNAMMMWTLTPISGVCDYGTYAGNGDASSGKTVTTGFQPSWIVCGIIDEGSSAISFMCCNRQQSSNTGMRYMQLTSSGYWRTTHATIDFTSMGLL